MKTNFEAVKQEDETWAVKTQIRRNGHWYTAAETFCVPGLFNAKEMADFISDALNRQYSHDKTKIYNRSKINLKKLNEKCTAKKR